MRVQGGLYVPGGLLYIIDTRLETSISRYTHKYADMGASVMHIGTNQGSDYYKDLVTICKFLFPQDVHMSALCKLALGRKCPAWDLVGGPPAVDARPLRLTFVSDKLPVHTASSTVMNEVYVELLR